jgi:hypothetical protein
MEERRGYVDGMGRRFVVSFVPDTTRKALFCRETSEPLPTTRGRLDWIVRDPQAASGRDGVSARRTM